MSTVTLSAIVLRYANYRDNDRMLTLFSPQMGRVEVLSRGCRRPKSPFMSASELFCTGEYLLYTQHDRHILTGCTLHDSFYPLRLDINKLTLGVYLLNLCEAAVQPGDPNLELFKLLIRSLNQLAYGEPQEKLLLATFLYQYAALLGYKPRLDQCVHCGKQLLQEENAYLNCEEGGLVCKNCFSINQKNFPISGRQVDWLRKLADNGPDSLSISSEDAPLNGLRAYVECRLDRPIKCGAMLHPDSN